MHCTLYKNIAVNGDHNDCIASTNQILLNIREIFDVCVYDGNKIEEDKIVIHPNNDFRSFYFFVAVLPIRFLNFVPSISHRNIIQCNCAKNMVLLLNGGCRFTRKIRLDRTLDSHILRIFFIAIHKI